MRNKSFKYIYIAVVLLFVGNLLGSCVMFLQIHNTTHFFLVNPIKRLIVQKDMECYRQRNENNINITRASFFPRDAIFFHSTSCTKIVEGYGACAIEAAARLNPNRKINLLYSSPVNPNTWSDHLDELVQLDNFRLIGIHVESYADGTEFEEFWKRVVIHGKRATQKEVSEYMKFLTLYKFGGTVLQLDVISNKPFDDLGGNWMVKNGDGLLATDAMSISRTHVGHNVTTNILRLLSKQILKGYMNGSMALTAGLSPHCPGLDFSSKDVNTCNGFDIIEDRLFHPVSRDSVKYFFQPGSYDRRAYAHRLWELVAHHADKAIIRKTLYTDIAQNFCPSVFSKLH